MNYVITGGCGFIGACLIQELVKDSSNKIRVVDNLSVGSEEQLRRVCSYSKILVPTTLFREGVEFYNVDLVDNIIFDICRNADVVIHMAAMSGVRESVELPEIWYKNNVEATFNLLNAVRKTGTERFIAASSGSCLGDTSERVHEEMPMHPISPYAATKSFLETFSEAYHHSYGIDTVCLRFSNVYGPLSGHKNSLVAKFIETALNAEEFEIYGDGEQTRDFIYVDDLVDAVLKCCVTDSIGGNVYQLCSGDQVSVNHVIQLISSILNLEDINSSVVNIEAKVGDVKTNWADNSKIKKDLGWSVSTTFVLGLKNTINWFLNKK